MNGITPENPWPRSLTSLLNEEIERMRNPTVAAKNTESRPLTLAEYKAAVEKLPKPVPGQIANLIEAVKEKRELFQIAQPGWKLVPLMMPHEHGYPDFHPDRLKLFGHLYYYCLTGENLTAAPDRIAYMDTVLPQEILGNGVIIPENFSSDPAVAEGFFENFEKAVNRMLNMLL